MGGWWWCTAGALAAGHLKRSSAEQYLSAFNMLRDCMCIWCNYHGGTGADGRGCVLPSYGSGCMLPSCTAVPMHCSPHVLPLGCLAGFLLYSLVALGLIIYLIFWVAPVHGTENVLVYLAICSLAGSFTVTSCKVRIASVELDAKWC
jgi:hypothetical protein